MTMRKHVAEKGISKKETLLTGAISNYVSLGTNILAGLCLTPLILSYLGKTGYGIWTVISTFIGYYGLLDLGISSAVQRYVALHKGQGEENTLNETISTALVTFFCTGIMIIAVSFVFAGPCAHFFNVAAEEVQEFKNVFRIIGIAIAITFPTNVFSAIITGNQKFVTLNYVNIATIFVRAGIILTFLFLGFGVVALALANLLSQAFKLAANFTIYRRIMPSGHLSWKHARIDAFRKIIYFGSVATVIMIANQMRMALDRIIVGKWVGLSQVAVYGLAAQLMEYIMTLVIQAMNVLTPRFSNLEGTKDRAEIKKIFKSSMQISAFLAFGFCLGAILFGERLIVLWVGTEFAEAKYVLWILSIGFVFDLAQNPSISLMFALNKHHLYAWTIAAEAIAKIALSLFLVTRYGMIGAALGTAIPMVVARIFVQPVYISKMLDIDTREYEKPLLVQLTIAGLIIVSVSYLKMPDIAGQTVPALISSMTIVAFIYGAVSIAFMDKDQKKILFDRIFKFIQSKTEPNV